MPFSRKWLVRWSVSCVILGGSFLRTCHLILFTFVRVIELTNLITGTFCLTRLTKHTSKLYLQFRINIGDCISKLKTSYPLGNKSLIIHLRKNLIFHPYLWQLCSLSWFPAKIRLPWLAVICPKIGQLIAKRTLSRLKIFPSVVHNFRAFNRDVFLTKSTAWMFKLNVIQNVLLNSFSECKIRSITTENISCRKARLTFS